MQSFIERYPEVLRLLVMRKSGSVLPRAGSAVTTAYEHLATGLPADHAWNQGKIDHARESAAEAAALAERLGLGEDGAEILGFLLYSHDIGRLVEARRQVLGLHRPTWHHGRDSVDVIRAMTLALPTAVPWFDTLLVAIEHHADRVTPTLEQLGGDRAAWAFTTLLRDLDKRAGFKHARRYTEDAAFKAAQAAANWPERRAEDPLWGTEMRRIDPSELLETFARREALERQRCRSYETYMLQYLAWVFDTQHPELLRLTLEEGGPEIVLAYLGRQLADAEFVRVQRAYRGFLAEQGA